MKRTQYPWVRKRVLRLRVCYSISIMRPNLVEKSRVWLTYLLLFLIPYSTFLILYSFFLLEKGGFAPGPLLAKAVIAWKELLLILLLSLTLLAALFRGGLFPTKILQVEKILLVIVGVAALIGIVNAEGLSEIVYGIRYQFLIFLFYGLGRTYLFEVGRIINLLKYLTYALIPILFFGLAQVFFLPPHFLINFGYYWEKRATGTTVIPVHHIGDWVRAMGTFPQPNHFAMYIVFALVFTLVLGKVWFRQKYLWLALVALETLVLLITFSRGHLLALILALIVAGAFVYLIKRGRYSPNKLATLITAAGLALILVSFSLVNLVGRADFTKSTGFIQSAILHSNSSAIRANAADQAIDKLIANPFGLGLAAAGPATANVGKFDFIPESWYLQSAVEMGWFGLFYSLSLMTVIIFLLARCVQTAKDKQKSLLALASLIMFIEMSIANNFLPAWYEMATITFWLIFGIIVSALISGYNASEEEVIKI
jgi:hypothetical protein